PRGDRLAAARSAAALRHHHLRQRPHSPPPQQRLAGAQASGAAGGEMPASSESPRPAARCARKRLDRPRLARSHAGVETRDSSQRRRRLNRCPRTTKSLFTPQTGAAKIILRDLRGLPEQERHFATRSDKVIIVPTRATTEVVVVRAFAFWF